MKPPAGTPSVRDYLHMLTRGWLVLVIATALSGGVGWLAWQTSTPAYQSNTKVLVTTPGAATTSDAFYGYIISMQRAATFQQLARSTQVTARTIEQLGLAETTDGLAGRITVPPLTPTIFDVVVSGRDPVQTREIAQVVTGHLIGVSRQIAEIDGVGTEVVQIDPAGPAKRVGSMWRTIVIGALLGLVLSALFVLAHGLVRDRLLGRGQLNRIIAESDAEQVR